MQPFEELADLPRHLNHPAVRDLAWTLTSEPLLNDPGLPQRHPLAGSRWQQQPSRLADWLIGLDRDATPLLDWLQTRAVHRLGHYYERLWQFALQQAPGIRLLAANLPIQRGNRTLGELDLLLEDADGIQHLELAVKFYLGCGAPAEDWNRWLGPGQEDRLDLKLEHLRQHQLPLSRSPAAAHELRRLCSEPLQASLWLGGYLFRSWPIHGSLPTGGNPRVQTGDWLNHAQLDEYLLQWPNPRWVKPSRLQWLAPRRQDLCETAPTESLAALAVLERPQLLCLLAQDRRGHWEECRRFFLCPPGWPSAAALGTTTGAGQIA